MNRESEIVKVANDELRREGQVAAGRNRRHRRAQQSGGRSPYDIVRPAPTPEHYHVIYHVVSGHEPASVPYYAEAFMDPKAVYERMAAMGRESEPNTEWYEDGRVQIETTLHGRTGLYRVLLEPAKCLRTACRQYLPKNVRKRELLIVPGDNGRKSVIEVPR